jgi:hypothetical protein
MSELLLLNSSFAGRLRWGRGQPFADFPGGLRRLFIRGESLLYSRKNFSQRTVRPERQVAENKEEWTGSTGFFSGFTGSILQILKNPVNPV